MKSSQRKLAAIMFTDIAGYSSLMSENESLAFRVLNKNREIHLSQINRFHGIFLKEIGDGILASFETVTDAVCCAAAIQKACQDDPTLNLRIGIHQGEVVFENQDVFGEGVNIASRIESLAPPGAIYVSRNVYQNISNNQDINTEFVREAELKNISYNVGIYAVNIPDINYLDTVSKTRSAKPLKRNKNRLILSVIPMLLLFVLISWWIIQKSDFSQNNSDVGEVNSMISDRNPIGVALPTGPRIAVLPFRNLSDDQEQEYFSDGLTEDIITALSRTDLYVLSFFPDRDDDLNKNLVELGKELGVRYLLKGSVRRDANTIRVNAQLFDTATGNQIWGESYSRDLTVSDIFAVQDDITARVVGTTGGPGGVIARKSMDELRRNPTNELDAYDCVLRSYTYEAAHTAESHLAARDCIENAVMKDSSYADLLGIAAYLYREEHYHNFNQRPNAIEKAMKYAQMAIDIDPLNQNAYHALAFINYDLGISKMDEFFAAARRTIELNPNNTRVGGVGVLIAFAGEWDWGIDLLDKTMTLNPYSHLEVWMHFTKAINFFRLDNYNEALVEINQASLPMPVADIVTIAINAEAGNRQIATSILRESMSKNPTLIEDARGITEHFFPGGEELHDKFITSLEKVQNWIEEDYGS